MSIESVGNESAAPEVVTQPEVEAPENASGSEAETPEAETGEYVPDYSFKYFKKDGEIEDWARQFIQDKETEERFRGLYSKAHGFDVLRERYKARDGEFQGVQSKMEEVRATLSEREDVLDELRHRRDNDLGSFFEYANVPIEKVIDFVEAHLKFLQKPEAEREEISKYREHSVRARELEKENQTFRQQREAAETESHVAEFEELCEHPEVAGFSERYDDVAGKAGAFREAVIDFGEKEFQRTGKTLPPLEAIRAVYRQYKPFIKARTEVTEDREVQGATHAAPQGRRPATIPNVGGSAGRAPTARVFTSVEELKAHHKQMMANEG